MKKQMSLLDAVIFATKAHDGQVRKFSGEPYIVHPLRVANYLHRRGAHPDVVIAAVLHDVVEDTPTTLHDLEEAGASGFVVAVVDALSRRPGETYSEFIDRAASVGDVVKVIKIADILNNLSDLPHTPEYESLRKRYLKALKTLGA